LIFSVSTNSLILQIYHFFTAGGMADPLGSLEKIVKLALRIKEAVDTVRQNKEECQQIRTRAVRVSSLLSRLPETGMTADPAMCGALEDLEDSLRRAHALVAACQESTTVCLYCTARKQARRLRRVQDDISQKVMLVVFATNIQTTIILTSIRTGDAAPVAQVPLLAAAYLHLKGPANRSDARWNYLFFTRKILVNNHDVAAETKDLV